MPTGRVKWFDNRKGFGFVQGESGDDVFIHYSAIKTDGFRTLNDGELVRYEIIQGPKGLMARDVQRVLEERTDTAGENGLQRESLKRAERFFETGGGAER
jgi:CspA family cold shock protein